MVNHRVLLFWCNLNQQKSNICRKIIKVNLRVKCSIADAVFLPSQHTVKTDWKYCYILRYFLVLHFASKVITFCVNKVITFCVKSYYILRYYYILRQKVLHFALLLHFVSVITFCGVTAVFGLFSLFYQTSSSMSEFILPAILNLVE